MPVVRTSASPQPAIFCEPILHQCCNPKPPDADGHVLRLQLLSHQPQEDAASGWCHQMAAERQQEQMQHMTCISHIGQDMGAGNITFDMLHRAVSVAIPTSPVTNFRLPVRLVARISGRKCKSVVFLTLLWTNVVPWHVCSQQC